MVRLAIIILLTILVFVALVLVYGWYHGVFQ